MRILRSTSLCRIRSGRLAIRLIELLLILVVTACTGHVLPKQEIHTDENIRGEGFVVITAKSSDSFSSLAQRYLNDSRKGWWISSYNGIDALSAGQRLVIPLSPITYGGLQTNGYQTVPILLYYQLANDTKNDKATSGQQFEQHLRFLHDNGYTTIDMDQLRAFMELKDQVPPKAVVITFDTVGTWVYEIAYPILKKYAMTAAIFITTEAIDKPGNLKWDQLTRMARDGFDVGTLGRSGAHLTRLKPKETAVTYQKRLDWEIAAARSTIQKNTASACRYFAYPTGETNDLLTATLKKHGFQAAFTRNRGSNPFFANPFQLRRSVIYGHYDMAQFKRNLEIFKSVELK
jgi:peptidoglycan/xylan/chitin deacetylase (PgdA/CDA1 family)